MGRPKMKVMRNRRKKIKKKWMSQPRILAFIGAVVLATTGCSLLSSKEDASPAPAPGFTKNVSTNKNEVALPVEVNNDLGRIVSGVGGGGGGGSQFESAGSGKIQVNVNVNFNGNGWTKTVTQTNGAEPEPAHLQDSKASENRSAAVTQSGSESQVRQPAASESSDIEKKSDGKNESYVVKKGDTLMKISFEKYGNVYRWREILNANKGKISNYNSLPPGMTLQIHGVHYVVIERNGHPYLIRLHDTLGKISHKVYGTNSFWRDLWKNNPQLIRDPNRIYAGFTLYYRDKSDLGTPIQVTKSKGLPAKRVPAESSEK